MNDLPFILILLVIVIYMILTIAIHNKLRKYNDKTPSFFMMQLRMPNYLKNYRKIDKIQMG